MTLLENLIQINADGVGGRESAAASGARRGRTVLQSRPVRGATPSPTWPSQPDYPARVPTHLWSRVSPKSRSCSSERRNHVSTVSETWAILVERNREIPEWETSCRSNGTSLVRPRHGLASVRVTRCGCVCVGVCARATRSRRCFVDACLHRRSIKRWRRVEYFDTGRESILAQDASSARSQHPAQPPLFASRLHRDSVSVIAHVARPIAPRSRDDRQLEQVLRLRPFRCLYDNLTTDPVRRSRRMSRRNRRVEARQRWFASR